MRIIMLIFIILFSLPVMAQDTSQSAEPQAPSATRIEADEDAGVIRFIVKGQEAAMLDEIGLHVRDEINYGATLTDTGSGWISDYIAKSRAQSHAE